METIKKYICLICGKWSSDGFHISVCNDCLTGYLKSDVRDE